MAQGWKPHLARATHELRCAAHKAGITLAPDVGENLAEATLSAIPDKRWYPLAIAQERETCARLLDKGVPIYRPKAFFHADDDEFETYGPVDYRMRGYVLAYLERDEDAFSAVEKEKGVLSFVYGATGGERRPIALSLGDVERFRKFEEIDCARAKAKKPDPRDGLYEGGAVLVDGMAHRLHGQTGVLMFLGQKIGKVLILGKKYDVEIQFLKKVEAPKKKKKSDFNLKGICQLMERF